MFKLLKILIFLSREVTKTIKNKTKEKKGGFLSMLLCTLGTRLLGHMLTGKGIVGASYGNIKGKGIVRVRYEVKKAGYGLKNKF